MKSLRPVYVVIVAILVIGSLVFALQLFAEPVTNSGQDSAQPNEQPQEQPTSTTPTMTPVPPSNPGTSTPTPVGQFFAPAVFDTASTATHTPVPTATSLYTATPGPTMTYPVP